MKLQNLILVTLMAGVIVLSGCGKDKTTVGHVPQMPQDNAPPLTPSGLHLSKVDDQGFRVAWDPNTEIDLGGYRVYLFSPCPLRDYSYVLQNENGLITASQYVYRGDMSEEVWVRVSAMNQSGVESGMTAPMGVAAPSRTVEEVTTDPGADREGRGGPIGTPDPEDRGDDPEHYDRDGSRHR